MFSKCVYSQTNLAANVFCPTGEGGGVDPSCSPNKGKTATGLSKNGRDYFNGIALANAQEESDSYKSRSILIDLSPDEFLTLAEKLPDGPSPDKQNTVAGVLLREEKFTSIPMLTFERKGKTETAQTVGHEGRHRAMALKALGVTSMPVIFRGDIRWDQQSNPANFDRIRGPWPKRIKGESGGSIKFPVKDPLDSTNNVFCPTGDGGGVDPTCSPGRLNRVPDGLPKGKWKRIDTESAEFEKYSDQLLALIKSAYADIGGHIKITDTDSLKHYKYWYIVDMDDDPEVDVVIFGKGEFGVKSGGVGHDGSKAAVEIYKNTAAKLKKNEVEDQPNWWGEVSGKAAYAMLSRDVPAIEDEETVKKLLGKDKFVFLGEHPDPDAPELFKKYKGWYEKDFGKGGKHVKIIAGVPDLKPTNNRACNAMRLFQEACSNFKPTVNAFCPTGEGGGQDNTCSSKKSKASKASSNEAGKEVASKISGITMYRGARSGDPTLLPKESYFISSEMFAKTYGKTASFSLNLKNPKIVSDEEWHDFDSIAGDLKATARLTKAGYDSVVNIRKTLAGPMYVVKVFDAAEAAKLK